jgi:hypothetical protein
VGLSPGWVRDYLQVRIDSHFINNNICHLFKILSSFTIVTTIIVCLDLMGFVARTTGNLRGNCT